MTAIERGPVADRLFTADEVAVIVEWFGGNVGRWRQHVEADSDVVNVGQTPDLRAVALTPEVAAVAATLVDLMKRNLPPHISEAQQVEAYLALKRVARGRTS